jgi:hypothetical protein
LERGNEILAEAFCAGVPRGAVVDRTFHYRELMDAWKARDAATPRVSLEVSLPHPKSSHPRDWAPDYCVFLNLASIESGLVCASREAVHAYADWLDGDSNFWIMTALESCLRQLLCVRDDLNNIVRNYLPPANG